MWQNIYVYACPLSKNMQKPHQYYSLQENPRAALNWPGPVQNIFVCPNYNMHCNSLAGVNKHCRSQENKFHISNYQRYLFNMSISNIWLNRNVWIFKLDFSLFLFVTSVILGIYKFMRSIIKPWVCIGKSSFIKD